MKVKELIEKLQQLDQEKNIHVWYDCYTSRSISILEASEDMYDTSGDIKPGDYVIEAW